MDIEVQKLAVAALCWRLVWQNVFALLLLLPHPFPAYL